MSEYWAICKCVTGGSILPVVTIFLLDFGTVHVPTVCFFFHLIITFLLVFNHTFVALFYGGYHVEEKIHIPPEHARWPSGFDFVGFCVCSWWSFLIPFCCFCHVLIFLYWYTILQHILVYSIFLSHANFKFKKYNNDSSECRIFHQFNSDKTPPPWHTAHNRQTYLSRLISTLVTDKTLVVQVNFQWDDDDVRFVLDQHVELDFYNASSLKKHVAPLRYVILIPSHPVFALTP